MTLPHGAVLSETALQSPWFAVLSAFVAINTIVYVALAVGNVLPKIYLGDWVGGRNRRAESRSIHPHRREN